MNSKRLDHLTAFSVTDGGPGTEVMKRLRFVRPELGHGSARTALILAILTWLPLLVLCVAEGLAFRGVKIPFLYDIFAHVKFLITIPTLVLAEIPIATALRAVIRHFVEAPLVDEKDLRRFEEIVFDAQRFRDLRAAEFAILGLSYLLTYMALSGPSFLGESTWFRPGAGQGLTAAGYWYAFVSLPVYLFLIFRWIYRIGVWTRCLWKVSKLNLLLTPIHPDGAGGLAFLGKATRPFGIILFALSAAISGGIASRVLFEGARLEQFQWSYIALMVFGLVVVGAPLMVFIPMLSRLKRQGLAQYASAESRYTHAFQRSKIEQLPEEGQLPDLSEVQTLDSFSNQFERIKNLRVIPIGLADFIEIAISAIVPGLPLLATVMPVEDIFKSLFKMLV